jgi:YD repeat-containing protein
LRLLAARQALSHVASARPRDYEYTGATTKVTDAGSKWKKQTTVPEPSPAGGADFTTSYTYDLLNQLTRVDMPRPYNGGTYTQVRTFSYNAGKLASETNPETGTITYSYDGNHRLTLKTDAKGQQTQYSYDSFGRVTQTRYYTDAGVTERTEQRIDYHYDTNPLNAQFSQNAWGRLTTAQFHARTGSGPMLDLEYHYSYNQAGRVTAQRMVVNPPSDALPSNPLVADAAYGWDNEGRMTSLQGPNNGPVESYTYDAMGRLASGGATYGSAGELLTFNGVNRTYNNLGQLTRMTKSGMLDVEYRYTAGSDNGRISQSKDYVTGEEVTYTYDALNRLSRAETTDSAWGNAYAYDGWGNLLSKTVTKGTAPQYNVSFDPALNMPVGSTPPNQVPTGYFSQYDVGGRAITGAAEVANIAGQLSYDPSGKKALWTATGQWSHPDGSVDTMKCEVYFHSITGQRLARYSCNRTDWDDGSVRRTSFFTALVDRTQHIGGKLTSWNGTGTTTDRLGSIRAKDNGERYTYYPYGETHTATVSDGGM